MNWSHYLLGSYYIIRSIFRFSDFSSQYLIQNNYVDLPLSKKEKMDESISSTLFSSIITLLTTYSIPKSIFSTYNPFDFRLIEYVENNQLQLFTTCFAFTYFGYDLIKCIYHKKYIFVLHHIAALNLLYTGFDSFTQNDSKGFYIMYFIFLLESNTPLLNIGYLLKENKFHYSITCASWIIHLGVYILFRLVMIPKLILIYYMYEGITWKTLFQLPNFMLILAGSTYWSYRQWIGIQKYLKENSVI
jgi:hypothetical protein